MADRHASGETPAGSSVNATGERGLAHPGASKSPDQPALADYSLSSPAMRQALKQQGSGQRIEGATSIIVVDNKAPAHNTTPAEVRPAPNAHKGDGVIAQTPPAVPVIPGAQLHDLNRTVDPCDKKITLNLAPADLPKPMDRVQDKDPALYAEIKDKVKDPRYIGQIGDITVSTHDKKGRVNGCVFIQNTPYWESADAATGFLSANSDLASKNKKVEADTLNGAGRTLKQEEAIAWRNTGVHAKPGKSNHGFGRAVDLKPRPKGEVEPSDDPDVRKALHAHGWRQGDSRGPITNDLHHWSYVGGHATEGHAAPPPRHHGRHHS